MNEPFVQLLLLLGVGVAVVIVFRRMHMPSSLGYLLVGVLLGPFTAGPNVDGQQIRAVAELGIVFLLFTIGLSFSLTQMQAMRNLVLGLGTSQVALTTAVVAFVAWLAGLPPVAAFVVGAVFAQSSTTIISKQLAEQGEEQSSHGRLGVAISVFQDVTSVPFVVIIPVLGLATLDVLAGSLAWALAKALVAFALVLLAGRWLFRPLFHEVASRRSAELFTLTVLFVSLAAAWTTNAMGLSMAFGGFLAGMMLGETEFRHQVEATIRPFRDVLLGLFFVTIGMLFDPVSLLQLWHWALAAALLLLATKSVLVAQSARWAGIDALTAWRTGFLLGVGGEFGFALIAIALDAEVIAQEPAQIALVAVLLSMAMGPLLIRFNHAMASGLTARLQVQAEREPEQIAVDEIADVRDHVIICGYGRIGQSVGHSLEEEGIPYVAIDVDPTRVRGARIAGELVYYGDSTAAGVLESLGVARARLLIVSYDDVADARKILSHVKTLRPELPVMVRTRDESHADELRQAGATEVVPETLEASMMISSHVLMLLGVPLARVIRRIQEQRDSRYPLLRGFVLGDTARAVDSHASDVDQLLPVVLPQGSPAVNCKLGELELNGVVVTALVRDGKRELAPPSDTLLCGGDAVVLFGSREDLERAEHYLLG